MITLENLGGSVLKITVPDTLEANDFQTIAPQVDSLISQYGKIRILIDASKFGGWKNMAAFEQHIGFVKTHHQKLERAAFIAGHAWQHWLAGMLRLLVHPEIRVYDKNQENQALQWLTNP